MPDKEITFDQSKEIIDWIKNVKGGHLVTQVPTFHNTVPGTGVYEIDGEPLLIKGMIATGYIAHILCSDKHAQELEASGILPKSEMIPVQRGIEALNTFIATKRTND